MFASQLKFSAPSARASFSQRRVDTPHPSASGAHLLPQGEKGFNTDITARRLDSPPLWTDTTQP
ncbi:hypothetical protein BDI01nite_06130 [Brevundimonas diminuta]|nr:hypothetical protein BDI01nite_06130 [Brevundimonas diminuta]